MGNGCRKKQARGDRVRGRETRSDEDGRNVKGSCIFYAVLAMVGIE